MTNCIQGPAYKATVLPSQPLNCPYVDGAPDLAEQGEPTTKNATMQLASSKMYTAHWIQKSYFGE